MARYMVTRSVLWVDGKKHRRGDIIETELDMGARAERLPDLPEPKKRRSVRNEEESGI